MNNNQNLKAFLQRKFESINFDYQVELLSKNVELD
jgi:hypothetical protein